MFSSSDPAVSSSIFVGAEREENLIGVFMFKIPYFSPALCLCKQAGFDPRRHLSGTLRRPSPF